jgi:transposase-like protein
MMGRIDSARLTALWQSNARVPEIALVFGVSSTSVYVWARKLALPSRHAQAGRIDTGRLVALWRGGAPVSEIALVFGVRDQAVYRALRGLGLSARAGPGDGGAAAPAVAMTYREIAEAARRDGLPLAGALQRYHRARAGRGE